MKKEIFANEMMNEAELDNVAGGAGVGSWFKAIGGTLLGVSAGVASIFNPALAGVAIVSLASGAKGIVEVATE